MRISSTRQAHSSPNRNAPHFSQHEAQPKKVASDSFSLSTAVKNFAENPIPKNNKWALAIPTTAGAIMGAATGLIGEGLGAGTAVPGMAVMGIAGAALGSRIDTARGGDGIGWTKGMGLAGVAIGAAGVVAATLRGIPGAAVSALSLGGTGFALGHLYTHLGK